MKVLVLGGTGFIGPSIVARLLAHGAEVAVFHRGKTTPPNGAKVFLGDRSAFDLTWAEAEKWGPEAVVDVRCMTMRDAREVVPHVQKAGLRYVFLSSVDVYRAFGVLNGIEEGRYPTPLDEKSELRTRLYPYASPPPKEEDREATYDKIPVEEWIRKTLGDRAAILRLPMVYGPRDAQRRTWPYAFRMNLGKPGVLIAKGQTDWRAPRAYVDDVGEAVALAALKSEAGGHTFVIGERPSTPERDWVERIAQAMNWKGKILDRDYPRVPEWLDPGMPVDQDISVDSGHIRSLLGFSEVVDSEVAMARTIEWQLANPGVEPEAERLAEEDDLIAEMLGG